MWCNLFISGWNLQLIIPQNMLIIMTVMNYITGLVITIISFPTVMEIFLYADKDKCSCDSQNHMVRYFD